MIVVIASSALLASSTSSYVHHVGVRHRLAIDEHSKAHAARSPSLVVVDAQVTGERDAARAEAIAKARPGLRPERFFLGFIGNF